MSLLLAILLVSPDPAHPAWMVGTWGWQNPGERGDDCGSDHTETYHRNGRYDFIDDVGTWRIAGNRLIVTTTEPGESGDPKMRGKSLTMRFTRVAPGVLRIAGPYPGKLIKCRAG